MKRLALQELGIGQLAELMGGRLAFGSMPPLGGRHEPFDRLVAVGKTAQPRDVVIPCPQPNSDFGCAFSPDELYDAGAFGLISEHPVCPWAGRFSIQVADVTAAVWSFVKRLREATQRAIVAVIAEGESTPIIASLVQAGCQADPLQPLAWQCLAWQSGNQPHVVCWQMKDFTNQYCQIIAPDVLVLSNTSQLEFVAARLHESQVNNARPIIVGDTNLKTQIAAVLQIADDVTRAA